MNPSKEDIANCVYKDIKSACVRKMNECLELAETYAENGDSSALLIVSAKADAINEIRFIIEEKAKSVKTLII